MAQTRRAAVPSRGKWIELPKTPRWVATKRTEGARTLRMDPEEKRTLSHRPRGHRD